MREYLLSFGFDTSADFILSLREITDQIVLNALDDNYPCCPDAHDYLTTSNYTTMPGIGRMDEHHEQR